MFRNTVSFGLARIWCRKNPLTPDRSGRAKGSGIPGFDLKTGQPPIFLIINHRAAAHCSLHSALVPLPRIPLAHVFTRRARTCVSHGINSGSERKIEKAHTLYAPHPLTFRVVRMRAHVSVLSYRTYNQHSYSRPSYYIPDRSSPPQFA